MQGGNILSIYSNTSVILRKEEQEKHSLPPTTYNEYPTGWGQEQIKIIIRKHLSLSSYRSSRPDLPPSPFPFCSNVPYDLIWGFWYVFNLFAHVFKKSQRKYSHFIKNEYRYVSDTRKCPLNEIISYSGKHRKARNTKPDNLSNTLIGISCESSC